MLNQEKERTGSISRITLTFVMIAVFVCVAVAFSMCGCTGEDLVKAEEEAEEIIAEVKSAEENEEQTEEGGDTQNTGDTSD